MTELHADNLSNSLRGISAEFDRAKAAGDWIAAEKLWRQVFIRIDTVIRESRVARIEADALATELQLFRPTRADLDPAPDLAGYVYVFTAKQPWICAAVERRTVLNIPVIGCAGYEQESYTPERKTVCGKATAYPVHERFASGGWPRRHELCPECVTALAELMVVKVAR